MKILVSGFTPFGDETQNATMSLIKKVEKDANIILLPTVFKKAGEIIIKEIERIQPDYVVMLGQAKGRNRISLERVAININSSVISDNDGNIYTEEIINENGPDAYFSTLPIIELKDRLLDKRIPVHISNTAGTYVCNDTFYRVMDYIKLNNLKIKAGFIHIPILDIQVGNRDISSMSLKRMVKALDILIQVFNKGK